MRHRKYNHFKLQKSFICGNYAMKNIIFFNYEDLLFVCCKYAIENITTLNKEDHLYVANMQQKI